MTAKPKHPPAILLMGPTASGKTDLAVDLTERLPVEIISVDSAMVYRGMDIGTAKPDASVLERVPHRLIDICDPAEVYSAAKFREDALQQMQEISQKGHIPLLVGGTMLYFHALQHGLAQLPNADPEVREQLEQERAVKGLDKMHQRLAGIDPIAARRIHPNDPQRILRALEVWELTGRSLSQLLASQLETGMPYQAIKLVRAPADRSDLHKRIAQRFSRMLEQGFEEEVAELLQREDLYADLPSMRSVGYRQMIGYLRGEYSRAVMLEKGIAATRQLAKRQMTWLRKEKNANWLDEESGQIIDQALKLIKKTVY